MISEQKSKTSKRKAFMKKRMPHVLFLFACCNSSKQQNKSKKIGEKEIVRILTSKYSEQQS